MIDLHTHTLLSDGALIPAEQIRRAGLLAERTGMFYAEAALWAMYLVGDIHDAPEAGYGRSLSAVA